MCSKSVVLACGLVSLLASMTVLLACGNDNSTVQNRGQGSIRVPVKEGARFPDPHGTSEPNIQFREYAHDFGVARGGSSLEHTFDFCNQGGSLLTISRVMSGCGCVGALLAESEFVPKKRGQIKVTMKTGGAGGKEIQHVWVRSNDPDEPVVKLTVTALVQAPPRVTPRKIDAGYILLGEVIRRSVTLVSRSDEELVIRDIESSSPNVRVGSVLGRTVGRNQRFEIPVSISAETPIGRLSEMLTIHTSDTVTPRFDVPIEGEVVGPIAVTPERLFFGFVTRNDRSQATVKIRHRREFGFRVLQFRTEMGYPFGSHKITKLEGREEYEFTLGLGSSPKLGLIEDTVELFLDCPEQPVVRIPVYAYVEGATKTD